MGDKGYRSEELDRDLAYGGITLNRPDRKDEPKRFGSLGGMRQWIESVAADVAHAHPLRADLHRRAFGNAAERSGQRDVCSHGRRERS